MARNPKILKTAEEIEKVPQDQPVHIEVEPEGEVVLEKETQLEVKKEEKEQPKVVKEKKVEKEEEDEATKAFRIQLDNANKATQAAKAEAAESSRRANEANKLAEDRAKELKDLSGRADQSEYDAILSGIGAFTAEAEAAAQAREAALAASDWAAEREANKRLVRAEAKLIQYEDGKANIEARREQQKTETTTKQDTKRTPSVDEWIDTRSDLLQSERDWLKAHPDTVVDPKKNTYMLAANYKASEKNLARGSPEYFKFMEEELGYRQPEPVLEDEEDEGETERTPIVAAPVSRDAPSAATGRPQNNNRVTLTPEQREIARMSGISDIEYARQFLKLQEHKRNGHYRES